MHCIGPRSEGGRVDEPLVIVSTDTHIGPRLREDLRSYCPQKYLQAFDEFADNAEAAMAAFRAAYRGSVKDADEYHGKQTLLRNLNTAGHHDMHARLRDLDADGVAAEVIFHGSMNDEPMPFQAPVPGFGPQPDLELVAAGIRMYNRWLADVCSIEPARHVGLAHLPMWDVDAAVAEAEFAGQLGLRSVNFPADSGPGEHLVVPTRGRHTYNDPAWEPLWAVCEDLDLVLTCHGGAGELTSGPGSMLLHPVEAATLTRRAMYRLVLGGVFERHPKLTLVLTEVPGHWWTYVMSELDTISMTLPGTDHLRRKPSEYCAEHVFLGASFQSPIEAHHAVLEGWDSRVMWGSDYPHTEGTWQYREDPTEYPMTWLSLRFAYADLPPERIPAMVGGNAIRVYGFDGAELLKIARRIAAPTLRELTRPLESPPERGGMFAFRHVGPFA